MSGSPDLRRPRTLPAVVGRSVLSPRKKAETGWIRVGGTVYPDYDPPAFENGWQNYDGDETSFNHVQFYLSEDGEVRIKGTPRPGSGSASGDVVFTLPEGYCPPKIERFEITDTDLKRAVCEVRPDGSVIIYYSEADIGASGGSMSRAFIVAMS